MFNRNNNSNSSTKKTIEDQLFGINRIHLVKKHLYQLHFELSNDELKQLKIDAHKQIDELNDPKAMPHLEIPKI